MSSKALPPIIIIGMHRSGTSVIMQMLEMLGLFVGWRKDPNNEALFFQGINKWLLRHGSSTWDHPEPIHYLLESKGIRALISDYIRYTMKTPRSISYFGLRRYLRYRSPYKLDFPWGWKDPRNTFTLPVWLDLFPDAKVIHIYRHGVDVANSLKVREDQLKRKEAIYKRRELLYFLISKRGHFADTARCLTMEGAFSLWEEYIREAKRHVLNLQDRAIEIRYEDFITEPHEVLEALASFCNLSTERTILDNVADQLKKGRAYAYRNSKELQTFADSVADRLKMNGY